MKNLSGTSLSGTSVSRDRSNQDFYATPHESTKVLLKQEIFKGDFLEPCVGAGHISDMVKEQYPDNKIVNMDLVDRGYAGTIVSDFLTYDFEQEFDSIITNPPYSLAQEFLEKSMSILKDGGKVAMFLKIQFLEGVARKEMFKKYPPKYVYVFSKRQAPLNNGSPVDENGKAWASTMCFAWFIWEKDFKSEPIIRWI